MATVFRILGSIGVIVIGILSLVPGRARPHLVETGSLEHVAAYFITAGLLCLGFLEPGPTEHDKRTGGPILRIAVLLIAYGGILEVLQFFVPGRGPALLDWAGDALGVWLGTGIVWLLHQPFRTALRWILTRS